MRKKFISRDILDAIAGKSSPLTCHIEGDWTPIGPGEACEYILKEEDTGLFFRVSDYRTIPYATAWFYESTLWPYTQKLTQVVPEEVTVTQWVNRKRKEKEGLK